MKEEKISIYRVLPIVGMFLDKMFAKKNYKDGKSFDLTDK